MNQPNPSSSGAPRDRVTAQIEEWAKDLIDLSRRNSALYYKRTKRSTLEVCRPAPEVLLSRLLQGEELHFFEPGPLQPGEAWTLDDCLEQANTDELVTKRLSSGDLRATLRSIHRASTADFVDRGLQTTYAAFGLLRWRAVPHADWDHSPLLFVPVTLEQASRRELHHLALAPEDAVLNPGLQVVLKAEHGIDLSDLNLEDLDSTDALKTLFAAVFERVEDHGWTVEPLVAIKRTTFHKEAMYSDLLKNLETIAAHETVASLATGDEQGSSEGRELPSAEDVDNLAPPERAHLILDADASQRAAVHAALDGHSFVMNGPPGTGKSQTIANMIAELMAAGRSVLFVSEKVAALDVVFKRLQARQLDDFLLQLHSHKATRKEVVRELAHALSHKPTANPRLSEQDRQRLLQLRQELTNYAAAMNETRAPLERSLFQVVGRLSQLAEHGTAPAPDIEDPARTLTARDFATLQERFEALGRVWTPAVEPEYTWRGFAPDQFPGSERTRLLGHLERWDGALEAAQGAVSQLALDLRAPRARNEKQAWELCMLTKLLSSPPDLPRAAWEHPQAKSLLETLKADERRAQLIHDGRADLRRRYGKAAESLESAEAATALAVLAAPLETEPRLEVTDDWTLTAYPQLIRTLEQLAGHLHAAEASAERVLGAFKLDGRNASVGGALQIAKLVEQSGGVYRPLDTWCSPVGVSQVSAALDELEPLLQRHKALLAANAELFDEAVYSLDVAGLKARFERVHTSALKWFSPAFWTDRASLKSVALDGRFSPGLIDALGEVLAADAAGKELDQVQARFSALLGSYQTNRDARVQDAREALTVVEKAVALLGARFEPDAVRAVFGGSGPADPMLPTVATELRSHLEAARDCLLTIPGLPPSMKERSVVNLSAWTEAISLELRGRWRVLQPCVEKRSAPVTARGLVEDLELLCALRSAESAALGVEGTRAGTYGPLWSGLDTDWRTLEAAIRWVVRLQEMLGGPPSRPFVDHNHGVRCTLSTESLRGHLDAIESSRKAVLEHFEPARRGELEPDLLAGFGPSADFVEELIEQIEDISLWIDYRRRRRELERAGFRSTLEYCEEEEVDPDELADVLEKSVLALWLETVLQRDPRLQRLRAADRDELVRQYQDLDRRLVQDASERVVEACNLRRPGTAVGAAGVIRREAMKKRRHIAVKSLMDQALEVIVRLKPCFMMSPLSVSQFLPAKAELFDVVIFDEASQVLPADAINAIYRGRQLIVAGDEKQLPPTNFFQRGTEPGDDIADEEGFDDFESILGQCRGTASFPELPLRWHYRSRDEALITFSNVRFYSPPGLITFPSPKEVDEGFGVQFIRVAGVYRRGTTRDNPAEAQAIAERVLFHVRRDASRTIGVIAFSTAQQDCIEQAIGAMREEHPELESFFDNQDRLDGFFVKNLEAVQGDERDIILFSVGYGPDEAGKMTMSFGPLNREGGWRRLNVAVTRARYRVEVVASFTPGELVARELKNRGVSELLRYLDYAARGTPALSVGVGEGEAEVESPFEESVLRVVQGWGYSVRPQVGAAGYRIDLGVRHPEKPGEFVLGIECDGARYHSSRVARDRDRLRQQVLEGLGWTIHRIWGPSWYRDRAGQERRLREAIERACTGAGPRVVRRVAESAGPRDSERIDLNAAPDWTVPYETTVFTPSSAVDPVESEGQYELGRAVEAVLRVEAPITADLLRRRVAELFGVRATRRLGRQVAERAGLALRSERWTLEAETYHRRDGEVVVRVPVSDDPSTLRKLEQIPSVEVELAVLNLVRDAVRVDEEELMNHLRSLFGFRRTGARIREVLVEAIWELEGRGELKRDGDGRLGVGE